MQARIGIATGLVVVGELIGEGAAQEAGGGRRNAEPGGAAAGARGAGQRGDQPGDAAAGRRRCSSSTTSARSASKASPSRSPPGGSKARVGAEGRFEARQTAGLTPLVGREEEIALLLRRWQQAKDGEGHVVLLSGEPGIGKSRLVREVRARLEDEPHVRLLYQCSPHHTTSPLHPVIEQLERAAGFARDDPPAARLDKLEALLARGTDRLDQAVPLIAALLGLPTEDRYPALDLTPQRQKQLTLQTLVDQLEGLAAAQPVLLAYEDVHWIDPTTQELLGLTIERVQRLPVLLLITFRPEFAPPWPAQPHVSTLALTRLGRREGAALVERVVRDKALPDEVAAQIVAKTDGVPLFVEELTKAVLESGLLKDAGDRYELAGPLPPLAIPTTLHDSLLARLDRLAPVKEIAQIGAALGREFSHALLAAVADRPEAQLQAALDQLVASELVYRRGVPPDGDLQLQARAGPGRRLRHPPQVPPPAAPRPHRAGAGGAVSRAGGGTTRASRAPLHRGWADRSGSAVLAQSRATGDRALDAGGGGCASDQRAGDASSLTGRSRARPARARPADRSRGGVDRAERPTPHRRPARFMHGPRELCRYVGETEQLFPVLYGQWVAHVTRGELVFARGVAEELLRLGQQQANVAAQAIGHRALGVTLLYMGDFGPATVHLERTIALYNPAQHGTLAFVYAQDPRLSALAFLAWELVVVGRADGARVRHREVLAEARDLAHPNTLAQVLFSCCMVRHLLRDAPGVVELAEALTPLATKQGFPYWLAMATILKGWALTCAGEPERGIDQMKQGLTIYRTTAAETWVPYFLALLADTCRELHRPAEGLGLLADALERVRRTRERWFEAELHRLRGETLLHIAASAVEAEESFRQAISVAREQGAAWWELRAATSLARLWARAGRTAEGPRPARPGLRLVHRGLRHAPT